MSESSAADPAGRATAYGAGDATVYPAAAADRGGELNPGDRRDTIHRRPDVGRAERPIPRISLPGMSVNYRFECPYCGSVTSIETQYAGLTGPCYSCGKMITVPTAEELESLQRRRVATPTGGSRLNVFLTIGLLASTLVGGVCAVAALFFFFLPGLVRSSSIADAGTKLEQVRLALELYHDKYGSYPPAWVPDATGKPMHSWRTLILDELGYPNVKAAYDFSKPWDAPENQAVLIQMPAPYAIDLDTNALGNLETSVVAIVGDGTLFPGKKSATRRSVTDDPATTLVVVERHESGISWTEPRDLMASRMSYAVNGSGANDLRVLRPEGAVAIMADGTTRTLSPRFSPSALQAIVTVAGGEAVDVGVFDAR